MKVYTPNGKAAGRPRDPRSMEAQRKGLLAKIRVGKSQLGMDDDSFTTYLQTNFKAVSLGGLQMKDLEKVLTWLKSKGFTPKKRAKAAAPNQDAQILSLRDRCQTIIDTYQIDPKRVAGLIEKLANVTLLPSVTDPKKLKQIAAALEKIGATSKEDSK